MMNNKFSELYHLAWGYAEFDDEYKEKPTYERRCVVQSRIFAELIVRECANIFEGVYTDQQRPERIDKRIKERFGIEE